MSTSAPLWLVAFAACAPAASDLDPGFVDGDGDGFTPNTGDCDDRNPHIHPEAAETWYDGVDQDCDGNDADRDGDGQRHPEDCDDDDPAVHPEAVEVWGDGVDADCDGTDLGAFRPAPRAGNGTGIGGPRLARLDDVVSVSMVFRNEGLGTSAWATTTFDDDTPLEEIEGRHQVLASKVGSTFELGQALDLAVRRNFDGLIATSALMDDGRQFAALARLDVTTGWTLNGSGASSVAEHFEDVALDGDDPVRLHVAGCGQEIWWVALDLTNTSIEVADAASLGSPADRCEVRGDRVRAVSGGRVTEYLAVDGALTETNAWPGGEYADIAWEPEAFLRAAPGLLQLDVVGALDGTSAAHEVAISGDPARVRLDVAPDGEVFVVYAEASGDLFLVHGDPEAGLVEVPLAPGIAVDDLDVETSDRALFVTARAGDEAWLMAARR